MPRYVAVIDEKYGVYGVTIPDLPGCTASGKTIDQAHRSLIEAVAVWVRDAATAGKQLPKPRTLEQLYKDADVAGAIAKGGALIVVPVLRDYGRSIKANLSLDAGLLDAINEAADAHGLTRSSFMATAAREKIRRGT
jgi:predicted RNase H-like HicB family nuclease